MTVAFEATFLGGHRAPMDWCRACGFLRARAPFWLEEAYSSAIATTDTGLLWRNLHIGDRLRALLPVLFDANGPFLDFAGGYGVLTRLMRDRGFDFWWQDEYAQNLLAAGFEYDDAVGPALAVTAFEVLEHVADPAAMIRDALAKGQADTFIFTTELYAGDPPPRDWHYYSFGTGQHIGFFRHDTLAALGRRLDMHYLTEGGLHMLTKRDVSAKKYAAALSRAGRLWGKIAGRKRPTLMFSDNAEMISRIAEPLRRRG